MSRTKVIPKRNLRPAEPIAWGLALGAALSALFIRELRSMNSEFLPFLAAWIAALCLFPLFDAYAHRTYQRAAKRSALFGLTLGSWIAFLHVNQPYLQIRFLDGDFTMFLIGISISAAAGMCAGGFASLLITFLLRKLLGHHRVHPCGLCTGCAYPLEGLDDIASCPECGRDRALPALPVWKQPRLVRAVAWGVITIALLAQFAVGARLFATRTVPMLRFRSAVPSNDRTGVIVEIPEPLPMFPSQEADATSLTRNVEVAHIARPMGLDITALHAKLILPNTNDQTIIEFRIGKASTELVIAFGGSSDQSRIIRQIWGERIDEFYDNGGMTDELITDLLETWKRRAEGNEIPTINLPN